MAAFIFCAFPLGLSATFWIPALVLSIVSSFGDRIDFSAQFRLIVQLRSKMFFFTGHRGGG